MIVNFDALLNHALGLGKKIVAIANAQDRAALQALADARKLGLVEGMLFGDEPQIRAILSELDVPDAQKIPIYHFSTEAEAVRKAVEAVSRRSADILLKGRVKTSTLLKAALNPEGGLRTGRLLSDVFLFENPARSGNQLVMITDGGVTILPDLEQKIQIIQNAVELAHFLGNSLPKVALLSAVETVVPSIPSTIDAAILSKMNQRGQIKGCIIDGPLALDNAVSPEALKMKGIQSPVEGMADILVPPEMVSANLLAKSTTYWAKFRLGHVIMGAKAPILIPSRADTPDAKLLSMAIGAIVANR
ncbi:MAG: bifunctional enoyl-CoA hydratase/phosphate acetyltransferase [Calditrichaeota bacterium]|nr:bifunctional enoyl-CoA hydratase/phosphate acetyltransferase [Calditrichota bacterium]